VLVIAFPERGHRLPYVLPEVASLHNLGPVAVGWLIGLAASPEISPSGVARSQGMPAVNRCGFASKMVKTGTPAERFLILR
jgi:hypothetical protein